MNLNSIQNLLDREITPQLWQASVAEEVEEYICQLKKSGTSVRIKVCSDLGKPIVMNSTRMQNLKSLMTEMNKFTIAYLFDAISLSEEFVFLNDADRDWCEEVADDAVL